ncbi:MAG: hypothetical protein NTZ24_10560 [Deltaproteobacteria bacterium]|nr:hypothetical protein [Deltaproteobacteria bacterium]
MQNVVTSAAKAWTISLKAQSGREKELIIKHLAKNKEEQREDFQDIFPELKPMDI